jgi:hypothetical protein
VKCDRLPQGCSNCTKANVECIYRQPAPPRRRKRKVAETDLIIRLRQYEELLRNVGIKVDALPTSGNSNQKAQNGSLPLPEFNVDMLDGGEVEGMTRDMATTKIQEGARSASEDATTPPPTGLEYGKIVSRGSSSRYLENHLWTTVGNEVSIDPLVQHATLF